MKKTIKKLIAVTTLAISTISANADPCGAVICLANNDTKPWGCKSQIDEYFDIRAYNDKGQFDPGITSIWRLEKTRTCKGAKDVDIKRINHRYGTLYSSPFKF